MEIKQQHLQLQGQLALHNMAHFAEINNNNIVLRVLTACNIDVANNGGDLSEQAAEHFKSICPLSSEGVKWVQTSYNCNFRKNFASIGMKYDSVNNVFYSPDFSYPSWTLNQTTFEWEPPKVRPSVEKNLNKTVSWMEEGLYWEGVDVNLTDGYYNVYQFNSDTDEWILIAKIDTEGNRTAI